MWLMDSVIVRIISKLLPSSIHQNTLILKVKFLIFSNLIEIILTLLAVCLIDKIARNQEKLVRGALPK